MKIKTKNTKEFIKKNKLFIFLIIISILVLILSLMKYNPYWDEAVYINNGKYLYSGQDISIYEYQRPPVMGLLTGFFWFLGLNEILFTKIVLAFIFILGLFYLYKLSEMIKKNSGIVTTLIFASLPTISLFSYRLLTEIPGTMLSIIGLYFFLKKRYFLSGFILSLAFLIRYPSGLVFLVLGILLLIEILKNKNWKKIKSVFYYGVGFSLLTVPFLIINYIFLDFGYPFLKRLFLPLINASKMVAANAYDLTTNGFIYYFNYLIYERFLMIFFLVFILGLIFYKKIRKEYLNLKKEESKLLIILFLCIGYFIYFSTLVHYEPRYFINALPFFSIIMGVSIIEILKVLKINKLYLIEIFLLILVIFNFSMAIYNQIEVNKVTDYERIENYYNFVINDGKDYSGLVAINNPDYGIFNESHKLIYLSGTHYAYKIITINYPVKYVLFEDGNLKCWQEEDTECFERLEYFKEFLVENYELVYEDYFNHSNHYIYRLK